jgi:hypothetical protein
MALAPPLFCAAATWLQKTKERTPKNEMTLFNDFIVASIFLICGKFLLYYFIFLRLPIFLAKKNGLRQTAQLVGASVE